MNAPLRLCLVLHNHQPVGNFDGVFEQAYRDSYLPFLDVFEPFAALRISLHTSGPLMEWLDATHPEYLDRLAALVAAGRIEIIGGAFYEPILTMIPPRDRVGQITSYTTWLEKRLGGKVQGMWVPERVWEQALTTDISAANIRYTVLDDFHFRNAGLEPSALHGYYITEDDGNVLNVFPGSERLRYLIPFHEPHETIDYLRSVAQAHPGAVAVFGDDGEKFGTWPDTKQHVYDNGWLQRFFEALSANQEWLSTTTLSDAVDNVKPVDKIYLPDASYREMTEWALPTERQLTYEHVMHSLEHDERWPKIQSFMRGGFWRNFKAKYAEANEMYARMMMISRRLSQAEQNGVIGQPFDFARQALYRGQCNCSYWHGAFGGIYLPHLRGAIFRELIAAENLLDQAMGKTTSHVEATVDDYNFDGRQEVKLSSDRLICLFAPAAGGQMYEFDVRSICHNLLATLRRRPEPYHQKVLAGPSNGEGQVSSIHDRVVFKQEGLDQRLQYDPHPRKIMLDHFLADDVTLDAMFNGHADEQGDFIFGEFETKIRRNNNRIQVQMVRQGTALGLPIKVTKGVTMEAGSSAIEIAYLLEGVPQDRSLHFGVEFNFAGLPGGAEDRYFHNGDQRLGELGSRLDLQGVQQLGLTDEWLGIDVRWSSAAPGDLWTFPVETVSQSEGGFELVHQSVVMIPHWHIRGDAAGRWSMSMRLDVDTSLAEGRAQPTVEAAAS